MSRRKRPFIMGRLGPALETPQPCLISRCRQMAGPVLPLICPHCEAVAPMWATDADSGHCVLCGATYFLALYPYVPCPRRPPGPPPKVRHE